MSSHREEASQLRKVIGEKEDDLHRTVQKYEEVLQVGRGGTRFLHRDPVSYRRFTLKNPSHPSDELKYPVTDTHHYVQNITTILILFILLLVLTFRSAVYLLTT